MFRPAMKIYAYEGETCGDALTFAPAMVSSVSKMNIRLVRTMLERSFFLKQLFGFPFFEHVEYLGSVLSKVPDSYNRTLI